MVARLLPDIIIILLGATPHTSIRQGGTHGVKNLVTTREVEVNLSIPVLITECVTPSILAYSASLTNELLVRVPLPPSSSLHPLNMSSLLVTFVVTKASDT